MEPTCKICGTTAGNPIFTVQEMMFGTGESFRYLECPACGCLQLLDPPHDLSKYYRGGYYSLSNDPSAMGFVSRFLHNVRADHVLKGTRLGRLLLNRFPNHALEALSVLPPPRDARILDVGTGTGSLPYTLTEIGFSHVTGIDPFIDREREYPNGLRILKTDLAGMSGSWDYILLFDSFEHMADPSDALRSIAGLLSPQGVCIMTIPTVTSFAWEHYRAHWIQIDAPRHTFLHSQKSLEIAAAHAGLRVVQTKSVSTDFQFWGSEQAKRGIPLFSEQSYSQNPARSIFTDEEIRRFKEETEKLNKTNRGDQMAVFLRKREGGS